MGRNRVHSKYMRLEYMKLMPDEGDIVRVVDPAHPNFGETGRAIKLELSYGQPRMAVRLDKSQLVVYMHMTMPATQLDESRAALHVVDRMPVLQMPAKITPKWREQVRVSVVTVSVLLHAVDLLCAYMTLQYVDAHVCSCERGCVRHAAVE
jgi:hypothetical protein